MMMMMMMFSCSVINWSRSIVYHRSLVQHLSRLHCIFFTVYIFLRNRLLPLLLFSGC